MRPSGVSATACHLTRVPFEGAQQAPALQVPHLERLSADPETMRPSGVSATAFTPSVWPSRVRSRRPLSRSHTLSVLSL